MPPEITALINLIGAPAFFVLLLALRDWYQGRSSAKQDDTITNLLTEINTERKASQERERAQQTSNNHLSAELTDLKVKRGIDEGRLIEFKEAMGHERAEWKAERAEWKAERAATDDKLRTMETSILDLQKNQRDNQAKIREHEAVIETLKKQLIDKDGEIVSLKATVLQLETEKAQLLDLNAELRKQIDERNARIDNLSLLNQKAQEANAPVTDNTQALPDLSVDDTVTPIPASGNAEPTTNTPIADNPAA